MWIESIHTPPFHKIHLNSGTFSGSYFSHPQVFLIHCETSGDCPQYFLIKFHLYSRLFLWVFTIANYTIPFNFPSIPCSPPFLSWNPLVALFKNSYVMLCSHTFTLFYSRKTSVIVKIFQVNFCAFVCTFPLEISSFFSKSFPFVFPFFCVIPLIIYIRGSRLSCGEA